MKFVQQAVIAMTMLLLTQLSFADTTSTMSTPDERQNAIETQIKETEAALNIRANQPKAQKAWENYKEAVRNRAKTLEAQGMEIKKTRESSKPTTALERIDQQLDFAQTNVDTLKKQKSALKDLMKELDDTQKTVANQRLVERKLKVKM